jgi:hypothetical protein
MLRLERFEFFLYISFRLRASQSHFPRYIASIWERMGTTPGRLRCNC